MDYEGKTKKRKLGTAENDPLASATGGEYEVFLSFRGIDTRKGFTDFLYNNLVDAGILTFRDDYELPVGEEIRLELKKAIEESKICIPIFSKNYASSKWCLLELAQIVECKRSTGQKILPIFYDVKPYDVRHQTGSYEEAFQQHEKDKRFDKETVQRWKEALKEVGELKGWDLQNDTNGHQGKLVKIVVDEVLSQLKKNDMVVTNNLVGIDHHVGEMERLLNVDSNDVRIVGICGMGGLGKTTIAKFIYNKLSECFDCCCFLEDVREKTHQDSSLVNLQKQLISKIGKGKFPDNIANVDEGIATIKSMACNKRVLIVLDDVDEVSQFAMLVGKRDWFGSRSRIIVTTRDKKVLDVLQVEKMYEPDSMKPDHALQLFSRHAFKSDFPPEGYDFLSKEIVTTTGRLPLALEITGSFFCGEHRKEVWEETLKKLRNIPDDQVQKKLRISYEALKYEEKQIFLDIACFFIGENKTLPFYMWDDCEYYPISGIDKLVHRYLVKIGDDNEFRMHDQLRDLGREIVRQENIKDPGERSRLWICKEALDVLDDQTGTNKVEALSLQKHRFGWKRREHSFTNDDFGKLRNLRFLRVDCTDLTGDFKNLLSKLRWLQWCVCTDNFKPMNFHLKNLVILDLSNSYITENWEGWSQIKVGKKLKVLDLSYCKGLTRTRDLSDFVMLKGLVLQKCYKLVEVRGLTGLKSLENLDMSWCTSLERLHDLSNLVMLKRINLLHCNKLVDVRGLTGLKSLEDLDMSWCTSLERLPDLSNLVTLKRLVLSRCNKLVEVRGLTGLKSLEELDMSSCTSLERLLDLSSLVMLKRLVLSECDKLVDMSSCTSLERLLDLSKLVMLKTLVLSQCDKLVEVRGLTGLKFLENLDMNCCTSLERLLDLSNLVMLRRVVLSGCDKLVEVGDLTGLKSLEKLDMNSCTSLERLLDLSNLVKLKNLVLSGCDKLVEVGGLTGLKFLENLDMSWCTSLERLLYLSNLVMLKRLVLSGCDKLVEVGDLTGLKSLEDLDMSWCTSLERLLDLSNLVKLKTLVLSGCDKLVEVRGLTGLKSLEELDMSSCTFLERLLDLSNLVMLKRLVLSKCDKLVEVRGLTGLKSLEELDMSSCTSLGLLDLSNLVMLKRLELSGCDKLVEVRGLLGLKSLNKFGHFWMRDGFFRRDSGRSWYMSFFSSRDYVRLWYGI